MLFSPALLRCCCGAAASPGAMAAAALSAALSITHPKTSPQEENRSPARLRGASGERYKRRRRGKLAPPPPTQPHPHPQVERCDRSCLEARRASGKRRTRRSF